MKLSRKEWNNYVGKLSLINQTAGRKMREWIERNGTADIEALVTVAFALTTKYGEAASATSCAMYDAIANRQKANVTPAEPKPTQNIKYVDKAVRSTLERAPTMVPDTVSEMVKRTGEETTLKNAKRDGAYFAWVPNGDSCPFCITLASNGWRRASDKTIKGDHADHIHKNCDCAFAISFDGPGQIAGYDPEKYLEMYNNAEGETWQDKVNSLRREQRKDPEVREKINAQQRKAYSRRQERKLPDNEGFFNTWDLRTGKEYDIIKPHNIYKDLNKTQIGREAVALVEKNGYKVNLLYGADCRNSRGIKRNGFIDYIDKEITIFVDETKSIEQTAMTFIHEANHLSDYGNCRKSELFCEIKAWKHKLRRDSLTPKEIRTIIKWVNKSYNYLPWKVR